MPKTITLVIPDFVETVNGVDIAIHTENWDNETAKRLGAGAFLQGLRIVLQREKSGEPLEVRQKAMKAKAAEIEKGTFDFGSVRGPRQTPEVKGWIAFLNKLGRKEGGKTISSNNLERAQQSVCREWLLKTKADEIDKNNLSGEVTEQFDDFVTWMEENSDGLRGKIEFFRKEAQPVSIGF